MAERDFVSIGEVLNVLKGDFPDVTISKIRFLESQGLLDPERTPSGYRKFYPADIERLRWILEQQRDRFLPLKVIRERLEADPALASHPAPREAPPPPEATPARAAPPAPPPRPRREAEPKPAQPGPAPPAGEPIPRDALVADTGLSISQLIELTRFGLLEERRQGSAIYYDPESADIARLAAAFLGHGVEARHLRMYRTAAEREANFLEQLVLPLLKQRNPDAHRQATATVDELWRLGDELRDCLLRRALRGVRSR